MFLISMQHIQYDKQLKLKVIFGMSTTSLSLPNTSKSNKTRKFKWVPRCKYLGTRWNKVANICVYYTFPPDEKQTSVDFYFFCQCSNKGQMWKSILCTNISSIKKNLCFFNDYSKVPLWLVQYLLMCWPT